MSMHSSSPAMLRQVAPGNTKRPNFTLKKRELRVLVTVMAPHEPTTIATLNILSQLETENRNLIQVVILRQPTQAVLKSTLLSAERNGDPFHIWHFSGESNNRNLILSDGELDWHAVNQFLTRLTELRIFALDVRDPHGLDRLPFDIPVWVVPVKRASNSSSASFFHRFYQQLLSLSVPAATAAVAKTLPDDESWLVTTQLGDEKLLTAPQQPTRPEAPPEKAEVFISYSHADDAWFKKFATFLVPLQRKYTINFWSDKKIKAGSFWYQDILRALDSSRVAVLLVTPNFLASDFIHEEELSRIIAAVKERGVKLIWVAISASGYRHTDLKDYQCANDPAQPIDTLDSAMQNHAFVKIADTILDAVQSQLA